MFPSATPPFAKYYAEYLETPEYEILKAKYQDLFDYVSENIGSNFTTFKDLFIIYDTLKTHVSLILKWGDFCCILVFLGRKWFSYSRMGKISLPLHAKGSSKSRL